MNIEDWLREDARRTTANPLELRLGGLVERVRLRRRRRAATGAASVVTVVAAGVLVWQVSGPWDRPVPPPATDPPVPAPTEEATTTPPVDSDWCGASLEQIAGDAQIVDGEAQLSSDLTLDITIRSAEELTLSPAVDLVVTAPGSDELVGYSQGAADGDLVVMPGEESSVVRGVDDLVTCQEAFSGAARVTIGALGSDSGRWQLADPLDVTFENGEITGADSEDVSGGESPDPGAEITAPGAYEPTCGQPWEPPTAYTGWDVSANFGAGPFQSSPDGSTGGMNTDVTLSNTADEELTADTYTQVVLVQDGTVVSPELLGSDDVRDTTVAPGEETTQSAGHQLWDYCDTSWVGTGPSVPAGKYTAYVLLLDAGPYWDSGERAVLAVSEGQQIEVTE